MYNEQIAGRIDNAFLKMDQDASVAALQSAIELTRSRGLRAICVPALLAGTVKKHNPDLRVASVLSYPLGCDSLAAKVFSASELSEQGIDELDVVMDLFAIVNGNWAKLAREARDLMLICRNGGMLLKCIIETPILNPEQIRSAAETLLAAEVHCLKTSTGYARNATRPEDVELLRQVAGDRCLIKASGGIRTLDDARLMLDAGADILGSSNPLALLPLQQEEPAGLEA
ncbi:deoxyribose-phosphate aldolase [bacterium]|nr:deoxyribose-phosphate aldolase [bacterium]